MRAKRPRKNSYSYSHLSESFAPAFGGGVTTAAYQIEGAISEDGRDPSI
ncbi:MAG TPA: hypothetical protein DD856_00040 [Sulfobacillus sp.]|nr:hypothetical protein [Sulfobacillus sp.]